MKLRSRYIRGPQSIFHQPYARDKTVVWLSGIHSRFLNVLVRDACGFVSLRVQPLSQATSIPERKVERSNVLGLSFAEAILVTVAY